jgi:hypothetical protein
MRLEGIPNLPHCNDPVKILVIMIIAEPEKLRVFEHTRGATVTSQNEICTATY